jgi:hypothetical protein
MLSASLLLALTGSASVGDLPTWITTEKIRGAYFHNNHERSHLEDLKANGCNVLLTKFLQFGIPPKQEGRERLELYAQWAEELDLHFFPIVNLEGGSHERHYLEGADRREVDANGRRYEKTPCPLDKRFWKAAVTDRAVVFAELSREMRLEAFVLDPEMYGADHTGLGGCYCDDCFREFYEHQGETAPAVAAEQRAEALREAKLADEYQTWLHETLRQMATETREAAHAIAPELMLGLLLGDYDTWCTDAIREGWGTPELPMIAFSETTYSSGYSDYIKRTQAMLAERGQHVVLCPGLWLKQFLPQEIPGHLYFMADGTTGYWLYTTYSLDTPPEKMPAGYRLPAPQADYWQAIKQANDEIVQRNAEGPGYQTSLRIVRAPAVERVAGALREMPRPADLRPAPGAQGGPAEPPPAPTYVRGQARYYVLAEAGETLTFQIQTHRLGAYQDIAAYVVAGPDGKIIVSGDAPLGEPAVHELRAEQAGVYEVVIVGKSNPFSAAIGARYSVLVAPDGRVATCKHCARMYFHVPADVDTFAIRVEGTGSGETAKLTVFDPDGRAVGEADTEGGPDAQVAVQAAPEQRGRAWSLLLEKGRTGIQEDATLVLDSKLPPYLADREAATLVSGDQ